MSKVGIAIDPWKLEIFKRHLDNAGYEYEVLPGESPGFTLLTVETKWVHELQSVVEAAQKEARARRDVPSA